MRAWIFQEPKQLKKLGGKKCPWSVGWYERDGRRRSKKIGSKSLADKYRRKKEGELANNLIEPNKRTKWEDFQKQYMETVEANNAARTAREYRNSLGAFKRLMKPVYVDSVTTATVDKFIAKRRVDCKEGESIQPATINKDLRTLKAALRKASKWKMLAEVPDFSMLREPERDPDFVDDATFAALYEACENMTRPADKHFEPKEWWQTLLTFAYLTGWRIGEIMALRRDDLDFENGTAYVTADSTKGKRDARIGLHPAILDHLKVIVGFEPLVFTWPHHERTLWTDFAKLKKFAQVEFEGAFHRFRFGFANANVGRLDRDVLQLVMRHQAASTTQLYINRAERMRQSMVADLVHVPEVLKRNA